ncbi:protein kinase domain-containing protein [Hymenobacter arizonensis]|uniref:Protein kinase domain-containing protein n=1 Tax=Hymenobacter arizonensis TaxID=1227077 RepID=A0A1I5Z7U8_HYMAR|nr:protein kinase [Hymenobacter arizonensis]SFQ52524.1 Protein kinase domain-containing protein [Hymenobacter arizonensis]
MMLSKRGGVLLTGSALKDVIVYENQTFTLSALNDDFQSSKGGNSNVFKLHDPNNNTTFAIKISNFPVARRVRGQANDWKSRGYARFLEEINALNIAKQSNYNNIVRIEFDGVVEVDGEKFPYFVMEKADTDLKEYIQKNTEFDEQERFKICLEVMFAVKQLHGKEIYHRDIKPDNILLFNTGEEGKSIWKISDLGLIGRGGVRASVDLIGEKIGPFGWLSPEAANKFLTEKLNLGFDCHIDNESDVFQLGKLFWFIYQSNIPVGQINIEDFIAPITKNKDYIFSIINKMLQYSKLKRQKIASLEEDMELIGYDLGV